MGEILKILVAGLVVVLSITMILAIPSFPAALALWVFWNHLLTEFVSFRVPHVGFWSCWASAFCVGWISHYLQKTKKEAE